jgi:hypothetical protein
VSVSGSQLSLTGGEGGVATITVTATDSNGNQAVQTATATVAGGLTITSQPVSQTVPVGGAISLAVGATGPEPKTYVWKKNGAVVAGATSATVSIPSATVADAGEWTAEVSVAGGKVVSRAAVVVVATPVSGRIINLSIRSPSLGGDQLLTAGFVVAGSGSAKPVLVRGMGPLLTKLDVQGALADPVLRVIETTGSSSVLRHENDNWEGTDELKQAFAQVGAYYNSEDLPDASADAALVASLSPGLYTAQVVGKDGGTGVGLAEVFDAGNDATTQFVNISARAPTGAGDGVLTAGFVLGGNVPRAVLVRGMGPFLTKWGVSGAVADPVLRIYRRAASGEFVLFAQNDNWEGIDAFRDVFTRTGASYDATRLPDGSKDAAIRLVLPAGVYTVQVGTADGSSGVALVEVYLDPQT